MWNWLTRRRATDGIPEYSAIRQTPNRGLPAALEARQADPAFATRCDAIQQSLLEPPERPQAEEPLFVAIIDARQGGVVTLTPDTAGPCLPIFSTPFRAADYARTLLTSGMADGYLAVSPSRLPVMLEDLSRMGIGTFSLDHCPRCDILNAIDSTSITSDRAIDCWSLVKATERARLELYLHYAQAAARAGDIDEAYEVVLETMAHVTFEDPRGHFLLGQIAAALHLHPTLHEAKAFLRYFKLREWEQQLEQTVKSDSRNYGLTP